MFANVLRFGMHVPLPIYVSCKCFTRGYILNKTQIASKTFVKIFCM